WPPLPCGSWQDVQPRLADGYEPPGLAEFRPSGIAPRPGATTLWPAAAPGIQFTGSLPPGPSLRLSSSRNTKDPPPNCRPRRSGLSPQRLPWQLRQTSLALAPPRSSGETVGTPATSCMT